MENIKGIIFDFGGTLDSRGEHWYHVMNRAWKASGSSLTREAYIHAERNITPLVCPTDTMLDLLTGKVALQAQHMGIPPGDVATRCYGYARGCVAEVTPRLQELHSHLPLAVVSNFYGNLRAVLADYGILGLFDVVIDSAEAGVRKPDPAIFTLALGQMGLRPSEVLVVGDSVDKDIKPAAALGCRTFLVEGKGWDED